MIKKSKKERSIQTELLVSVGIFVLLMGAVLILYSALSMLNLSTQSAQKEVELTAQSESSLIQRELDTAMDSARTLAATLKGIKTDRSSLSRGQVNALLKEVLIENPNYTGVYTLWEPNAFDGKDFQFVGSAGHDETGRFLPYWSRDAAGNINMTPLEGYNQQGSGDYYQIPKRSLKESIIEPYGYQIGDKNVLMTSLVVPIVIDGKFYGIAGVDLALDFLQTEIDKIGLYDGTAQVYVYSHDGAIAAAKGNPEMIGKSLSSLNADGKNLLTVVQAGKLQTTMANNEVKTLVPMAIGDTTTPWSMNISVPLNEITREATRSMLTMIGINTALLILVLIILFFQLRQISEALIFIAEGASRLALGDLAVSDMAKIEKIKRRRDEISSISRSIGDVKKYLADDAEAAQKIAQGDLTIEVQVKSEADLLGYALKQMVQNLREMITQITENASSLGASSEQLAAAASQAGQATAQIAATIQQVASGTTQQSESASTTAGSMGQTSRAIDSVARGAQEQASAVTRASTVTAQITEAINHVTKNIQSVSHDSAAAAASAKEGARSVEDTLQGMEVIKSKVGISTEKVQDMGTRSEQIGMIVETIEDIASQTNLLALNAAIEAARAGENGKGFAVVADEVRRLAERSAAATREIGNLVHGIQKTVTEAVNAMSESSQEVEAGVKRAHQSGVVLQSIMDSVETVSTQAGQAAESAGKMSAAAKELVSAMDSVSAVVEENTAATEEMSASASEVEKAIENIASVSEENSAAVEEVSASAEEMSAQVEEVTASAQSLADMAQKMNEIVVHFKLDS